MSPHRRKFIEVKCRVGFNWANFIECGQHVTVECRVESLDEHDYANNEKPLIVIQINGEQIEVLLPLKSIISSYCCSHFRSVSFPSKNVSIPDFQSHPTITTLLFTARTTMAYFPRPPSCLFVRGREMKWDEDRCRRRRRSTMRRNKKRVEIEELLE